MIYVTGDIHGDPFSRLNADAFPEQKEMEKDDFVLICGDFGCIWDPEESAREKYKLNWLEKKPFTTLFVDGNHENHDRLDKMPVSTWRGGKVHFVRDTVIHLMRGQFYEDICGKNVFSFGGARSHDIRNLLDPDDPDFSKKQKGLRKKNKFYRVVGTSWWEREMPSKEEYEEGRLNLEKHKNKVDFIVSHECPQSDFEKIYFAREKIRNDRDPLKDYLESIKMDVDYQHWFFGHHHLNIKINEKDILVYEQLIRIA